MQLSQNKKYFNVFFSIYLSLFLPIIGFSQMVLPKSKHRFVVIAHRGDHTRAPENTLKAYQHAIKNGVDYVEIDLRMTKDSQLVISHDESLNRMTGMDKRISELNLDDVKKLRIRENAHPEWGEFPIPTFEQVLQLCKGRINIYLDFKHASVQKTMEAIHAYQMQHQIIVYINSPDQFKEWRTIAPQMPLMVSLPVGVKTAKALNEFVATYKPDLLDGSYDDYDTSLLEAAAKNNIPVWPDIQSSDEQHHWDKAVNLGLKGLQTDHPKALIRYLKKSKLRS